MERFLTVNEVANILRVDPKTVRIRIRDGLLTACKPPGSIEWRISEQHLAEYLNGDSNGTTRDESGTYAPTMEDPSAPATGIYYMDIDLQGEATRHLDEIKACILQAGSGLDAERVFWLEALGYIVNLQTGVAWQYD